jgi:NDP-sugar pyrophosphorylase family protein
MSKRAVILAGGKGTRLMPYTASFPKPLVPVGDFPILEIVIRKLASCGFTHITLTVNHLAELLRAFFGDGSKWNVTIDYSFENEPLGTMGPVRLIRDLPDHFLVMNGDILSDLDYGAFYRSHVEDNVLFTISSYIREHVNLYGVLEKDHSGLLTGFEEKPLSRFEVSMGVYMLSREVLEYIPEGAFGFDGLMHRLISAGRPVRVKPFTGHWLDIGRPDDYAKATALFEAHPKIFLGEN